MICSLSKFNRGILKTTFAPKLLVRMRNVLLVIPATLLHTEYTAHRLVRVRREPWQYDKPCRKPS